MKKTGEVVVIGLALFLLYLALPFFGLDSNAVFKIIEWITKFILPWIFLYWLMRLVKTLDRK